MARRLDTRNPDFDERFSQLIMPRSAESAHLLDSVRTVLEDVRREGDYAVRWHGRELGDWTADGAYGLSMDDWDALPME